MNRLILLLLSLLVGCPTASRVLTPIDSGVSDIGVDASADGSDVGVDTSVCVPADCDDGDPCTTDGCDEGVCRSLQADGVECDDGDLCTTNDRCTAGVCGGTPHEVRPELLGQVTAWGNRTIRSGIISSKLVGGERAVFVRSGGGHTYLSLVDISTEPMTRRSELRIPGGLGQFSVIQEADDGPLLVGAEALDSDDEWQLRVIRVVDDGLTHVSTTTFSVGLRSFTPSAGYRHASYLCTDEGVTIIDLRDPMSPQRTGNVDVECTRLSVDVGAQELYVSGSENTVRLDIRDPLVPASVGSFPQVGEMTTDEDFVTTLTTGDLQVLARPDFRVVHTHPVPTVGAGLTPSGLVTSGNRYLRLVDPESGSELASLFHDDVFSGVGSAGGNGRHAFRDGHIDGSVLARVSDARLDVRRGGAGFGKPSRIFEAAPGVFGAVYAGGIMPLDVRDPSAPSFGATLLVDLPIQGLVVYGTANATNVGGLSSGLYEGTRYVEWDGRTASAEEGELVLPAAPSGSYGLNFHVQGRRGFHVFSRRRLGERVGDALRVLELVDTDEGRAWSVAGTFELELEESALVETTVSQDGREVAITTRLISGEDENLRLYEYADGALEELASTPFVSFRSPLAVSNRRVVVLQGGRLLTFVYDAGELRALPELVLDSDGAIGASVHLRGDTAYVALGASLHVLHFREGGFALVDTLPIQDSVTSMVFGQNFAIAGGANTVSIIQPFCPAP